MFSAKMIHATVIKIRIIIHCRLILFFLWTKTSFFYFTCFIMVSENNEVCSLLGHCRRQYQTIVSTKTRSHAKNHHTPKNMDNKRRRHRGRICLSVELLYLLYVLARLLLRMHVSVCWHQLFEQARSKPTTEVIGGTIGQIRYKVVTELTEHKLRFCLAFSLCFFFRYCFCWFSCLVGLCCSATVPLRYAFFFSFFQIL